jgi:uncharacterized protein YjbI with pentapeptide repeats
MPQLNVNNNKTNNQGFMRGSTFADADFSNAIVDRCDFQGANLQVKQKEKEKGLLRVLSME